MEVNSRLLFPRKATQMNAQSSPQALLNLNPEVVLEHDLPNRLGKVVVTRNGDGGDGLWVDVERRTEVDESDGVDE
jgi:hypothetical protein